MANRFLRDYCDKLFNPDTLRSNLVLAAVFIAAFEFFRAAIIDQLRGFFGGHFDLSKGESIAGPEYASKVRVLHKNSFDASLLWYRRESAIDDADLESIRRIREHRNELAHQLPRYAADEGASVDVALLMNLRDVAGKLDRWWIREIEIPANPDFDGQSIRDEDISSGQAMFMQLLIDVAVRGDRSYLNEVEKRDRQDG